MLQVDGRHRYAAVLRDALHLHKVARCGGLMIMDDVCNPTSCHAHFPDGTNHPYVIVRALPCSTNSLSQHELLFRYGRASDPMI